MGLVRMVRPWNEWLIVWGYDINQPPPRSTKRLPRRSCATWSAIPIWRSTIKSRLDLDRQQHVRHATSKGRVFCMGDAIHRHPPSNGLGSNTSIQDAFNLAWKLAFVLKGKAGPKLLDSYQQERAPVAKQIVTRANKSIEEFGPIFKALGLLDSIDPVKMQENMDARCNNTPAAEAQRASHPQGDRRQGLRVRLPWRRDEPALSISSAIVTDGQAEPAFAEGSRNCTTSRRAGPAHGCRMSGCILRQGRKSLDARPCRPWPVHRAHRHWRPGLDRGRQDGGQGTGHRHSAAISSAHASPGRTSPATGRARAKSATAACLLVRPDQHVAWRK